MEIIKLLIFEVIKILNLYKKIFVNTNVRLMKDKLVWSRLKYLNS